MLLAAACATPVAIKTVAPAFPKPLTPVSDGRARDLPVVVRVLVSAQGTVSDASIAQTTGIPILDDAAVIAVKQWQFQPSASPCTSIPYGVEVTFAQVDVPKAYDACNHDVFPVVQAVPYYPDAARGLSLGRMKAIVEVTVDQSGAVTQALIAQSANNTSLNQVSLDAARDSVYAPKFVGCKAAPGRYNFVVEFDPYS
jgi:TonB family protein